MHYRIIFFSIILCLVSSKLVSQTIKPCATDEMYFELLENNPSEKEAILDAKQELEELSKQYQKHNKLDKTDSLYIIPVVFHVLHLDGDENISDDQIKDVVRVVNDDFRKMNYDTNMIVDEFKPIAADTKIEIRLAKIDPNGNCTNGIDRIFTDLTNAATDASKLNQWPRDKYLNVWVVASIGSGAAGYAYYPFSTLGNNSYRDGIVILSNYVGSIGSSAPNRSRTLTHEIGHYLNLPHTWGSSNSPGLASNCNIDDGISDTPLTMGHTVCSLGAKTCDGTLDNVQNYMEYSYCTNMFTYGQASRMHATLNSTIAERSNLHSAQNLQATGVLEPGTVCEADFSSNMNYACINDTIIFFDESYHNPKSWLWNLEGASPQFHVDSVVYATYPSEGVYDSYLMVADSTGTVSEVKEDYIYIFDTLADYSKIGYTQDFESNALPQEWLFIKNSYGHAFQKANVGFESSSSVYVDNFGDSQYSEIYELISPSFDLTNLKTPKFIIRYAYATIDPSNNDKLEVLTSKDCGKSWDIHFSLSGAQLATETSVSAQAFVPDSSQWRRYAIPFNNNAKNHDNVLVKVKFTTGGGNNFFLDQIELDGLVGIEEFNYFGNSYLYPNPSDGKFNLNLQLQSSENVRIEVYNLRGEKLKTLELGKISAGMQQIPLDVEEFANGMFFVNVNISNRSTIFKLIKQ